MVLLFLAAALSATPSPAAPRKLVAVDWVVTRADPSLGIFYAAELARMLRERGLSVVTSQELVVLLGQERQRALMGCETDTSCLAELSSAVGCDATLMVNLTRLDTTLTANLKVVSTRDGHVLAEARAEAVSERSFREQLEVAAGTLADRLMPERSAKAPASRALLPAIAGGVLLVAGGVGVGLAWNHGALLDAELKKSSFVSPEARALATTGRTLEVTGWVTVGAGLASLGVAGVMALVAPDSPVQATAVFVPGGAGLGVAGVWP